MRVNEIEFTTMGESYYPGWPWPRLALAHGDLMGRAHFVPDDAPPDDRARTCCGERFEWLAYVPDEATICPACVVVVAGDRSGQ